MSCKMDVRNWGQWADMGELKEKHPNFYDYLVDNYISQAPDLYSVKKFTLSGCEIYTIMYECYSDDDKDSIKNHYIVDSCGNWVEMKPLND